MGGAEFLDKDGHLSQEAAERAAKKKASEGASNAISEKFGAGAAEEFQGLLGDDGMPDQDKLKSKAQTALGDGLAKVGTFFVSGGKGTRYEKPSMAKQSKARMKK
jgi:hypothetical protein